MKLLLFSLLFSAAIVFQGCKSGTPKLGAPEDTFEKLVKAIQDKDLDSYTACWYAETAEREGMVSQLKISNTVLWSVLQAMFKGPQTLKPAGSDFEENGKTMKKFTVDSPEVAKGDRIGSISMVKDGDVWKMYHW
jgi:hypothetical protein